MYLKALHVQGFKSFPDKTIITFGTGMTAIVGPNGSGKSNISDAVRWVLGEQSSKTLRGAKMEDVIFGGTQKRGPVGFAEVSLIIDNTEKILNSEYNEVMITRRYFRTGDGEYFINKKSSRLRDIHELFMDTGLGRDGYSMIGQGKIDEILSLKSEDRREVFEEAAGITKFRYKKEEAERKLKTTEENLVRIRDILAATEERLEPLRIGALKAEQFLKLSAELREIEVLTWVLEITEINQKLGKLNTDIEVFTKDIERLTLERETHENTYDKLTEDLKELEIRRESILRNRAEIVTSASDEKSKQAVIRENIKNNEANFKNLETDLETSKERLDEIRAKVDDFVLKISEIEKQSLEIEQKKRELLHKKDEFSRHNSEQTGKLAQLSNDEFQIKTTLNALNDSKSTLEALSSRDNTRKTELLADLENINSEINTHTENVRINDENLKKTLENRQSISNMMTGIELKRKSRAKKLEEVFAEKNKFEIEVKDLQNRIRVMSDMDKHFEGYPKTVKSIMKQSQNGMLKGINGPVSALISTEKDYVVAVETALSASASNIVTDTDIDAKRAIEYLKNSNGGRATFLALNVVKPSNFNERDVQNAEGFVSMCDKLVTADKKYDNLVSNLLGRVVVAENLTLAMQIAKKFSYRFRIVTLDGQVINAGGSMTGGSVSSSSGAISRANTIRELEDRLEKNIVKLSQISDSFDNITRENSGINHEYNAILEEKNQNDSLIASFEAVKESSDRAFNNLIERQQKCKFDFGKIDEEALNANNEIARVSNEISVFEEKLREIFEEIHKNSVGNEEIMKEIDKVTSDILSFTNEIDKNNIQKQQLAENTEHYESIITSMESEWQGKNDALQLLAKEKSELIQSLKDSALHAEEFVRKEKELSEILSDTQNTRNNYEGKRNTTLKEMNAVSDTLMSAEREKSALLSKTVELEGKFKFIHDKMWEKYELTPNVATDEFKGRELSKDSGEKISDLRSKIRALGTVNVGAIEEYHEVLGHFTFVSEQKEDIEKAKYDLLETIDRLTENMKTIFKKQFALLNEYFGSTFVEVFGGGFGELVLEDTEDVLNCGIEIRVSLPGKTLKTITLLSGGEKAFVAIALYFAILKVRPAPFCFLDEIEAALDDVNVTRFAKYLRKMTEKTQFIVITHRRGTMEEADMLYGVTMQNQGISKLLMLNVSEVEKELNIKI